MNISANIDFDIDVGDLAQELGLDDMIESKLTDKFEYEWSEYYDEKFKDMLSDELTEESPLGEFISSMMEKFLKTPKTLPVPPVPIDKLTLDSIVLFLTDIGYEKVAREVKEAFDRVIEEGI